MKTAFGGIRFDTTSEITEAVTAYFKKLDRNHFDIGISKLVTIYQKCIESDGDFVEK
ncbi:hypothetical protein PGB90_002358 [Kerria lacca]